MSCSFRTIVHKGLVAADALADFYLDLADERFAASFAIFHQRFSTNTLPTWERAQPFRMLCHNGEINTIGGNANRMRGRGDLGTEAAGLGAEARSDRCSTRRTPTRASSTRPSSCSCAAAAARPTPWPCSCPRRGSRPATSTPRCAGSTRTTPPLMEPWDGPAGVIFTDGIGVGAALDRNGLRPLRYAVCEDGLVVCASEVGAVDLSGHGRVERGRLGPGHMLWVSPERRRPAQPRAQGAAGRRRAVRRVGRRPGFSDFGDGEPVEEPPDDLLERQLAHGYTKEELAMVLKPMANDAYEPTFSMGDDSPLPRSPAGPARSPTSCASDSPRSPTRRSTRCASAW